MATDQCICGKPLHYQDKTKEKMVCALVEKLGEFIPVAMPRGTWYVPRHYIALHGLKGEDLPELAEKYKLRKQ